ncbi:MAG: dienelactone hydrolase family protein [Candidatus Hydrogenedentota bacterium]
MHSILLVFVMLGAADAGSVQPLPGTAPLEESADFAATMVAGIDRWLMRAIEESVEAREAFWQRDFAFPAAYVESIAPNRQRFSKIIGLKDARVAPAMELLASPEQSSLIGRGESYEVHAVRWAVLEGVYGEGLLLRPKDEPKAFVVAMGDCAWTPEMLVGLREGFPPEAQYARRLAESGCMVVVLTLLNRECTYAGNPGVRMTNQPHREFVYRAAYEMGRHVIGYEVHKILAAVDWFRARSDAPVGVMGAGEGGLLALYAAAVDTRIDATVVSGYFGPRERVWEEPIYRNVWTLLHEFGDAEIASLVAPRSLIVEAAPCVEVNGPPPPANGRKGAAPGRIRTPEPKEVEREVARARALVAGLSPAVEIAFVNASDGHAGSDATLKALLDALGFPLALSTANESLVLARELPDSDARMKRQFDQLVGHTQRVMREAPFARAEFWKKADASSTETWERSAVWYRDYFWEEIIGKLPPPTLPPNARTRLIFDEPKYRGYEVKLDVYPDVFAYGLLLVPKDLKEGERRPVVVCQHGLEGTPHKPADPAVEIPAYNQYGCRLAERGFVVYAPQNPYIGGGAFRVLQRKANPLKLSLFSFIVRQHERTLDWLSSQPFVDPQRIAFYGISYGGKTAMRVPAILPHYCLSICSADYNEWIWKNVSIDYPFSYLFTGEYEMPEFDLGDTFNYAEMSWLIFPRPFMVERGHWDGVSIDEWVAYEYARTRRHYDKLGLGDRTEIEYFNGPHAIHGVGTFGFLHEKLDWPEPQE